MEIINSPFPADSSLLEKHQLVREAFNRWDEFPEARTIRDVIVSISEDLSVGPEVGGGE